MKLLFYTTFYPTLGGMEANAEMLADEWSKAGVEVVVVTRSQAGPNGETRQFGYPVIRNPRPAEFFRLTRKADVFLQNAISLKGIWPLLFVRKPFVVRHGTWYNSTVDSWAFLKKFVTRLAVNISNCEAVARELSVPSKVIYNPYDDQIFHSRHEVQRNKDLIFVGRLVTDKGVDTLLTALAHLKNRGIKPTLTIIGDGPERKTLESQATQINLQSQVVFVGRKERAEVAQLLCEHKILVVPSRFEPFGNVAIEGIACGCVVVGASVGGLPEAIGNCGLTFQKENSLELAEKIETALTDNELGKQLLAKAPTHLEHRQPRQVAARYLEVIQKALAGSKKR